MITAWNYKKLSKNEKNIIITTIKKLYEHDCRSDEDISNILDCNLSFLKKLRKDNNITRNKNDTINIRKNNNLKKYGVDNPAKLDSVKKQFSNSLKQNYKNNKKSIIEKRNKTNLEKYGFESPLNNDNIKQKWINNGGGWNQEKIQNIKEIKYGNKYYNNYDKIKNTLMEKYNVNSPISIPVAKDKAIKTCLTKYGTYHQMKSKFVLDKSKQTKLTQYGNENYVNVEKIKQNWQNKSNEEKQNIVDKRKTTMINKYGIEYPKQSHLTKNEIKIIGSKDELETFIIKNNIKHFYQLEKLLPNLSRSYIGKKIHEYNLDCYIEYLSNSSKYEVEIEELLINNNITFNRNDKSVISPLELDFYLPKYKVALEINGTYWHSSLYKDKNYHYNKSKLCEEKGIRLIHIWEYEWENDRQRSILENIILSACGKIQNKIYARNCKIEVRKSKLMKEFFEENNIQGFRGGKFAICLIYNNETIMSYIIGKAFFGKGKYEWEVIRGATKLGYNIVGGASKIWKYFKENYNPQSCVYYVDYNYFDGKSIQYLDNFKFIKTQPGFKNWWKNSGEIKNRDPKNHSKIKQLEQEGSIIPIYNAGTKVYVWKNK